MKLIDKSALVAEIERLKKTEGWCQVGKDTADVYYARGFRFACERILSFLDTLEVKEVDLQSEIDRVWDNTSDNFSEDGWKEFEIIAKHFFELGLSVSSTKVTTPDIDDVLKENGVNPYSKEAKVFKESYYVALEKLKAQKEEEV